jgi:endogenous inhibitor of DNA gyrase (YacG/DUF329 family)
MPRPIIPCPHCKKALSIDARGIWPFCSERCRLLDLGAWAEEKYRVEAVDSQSEIEEDS